MRSDLWQAQTLPTSSDLQTSPARKGCSTPLRVRARSPTRCAAPQAHTAGHRWSRAPADAAGSIAHSRPTPGPNCLLVSECINNSSPLPTLLRVPRLPGGPRSAFLWLLNGPQGLSSTRTQGSRSGQLSRTEVAGQEGNRVGRAEAGRLAPRLHPASASRT